MHLSPACPSTPSLSAAMGALPDIKILPFLLSPSPIMPPTTEGCESTRIQMQQLVLRRQKMARWKLNARRRRSASKERSPETEKGFGRESS
ncbi:MAG: hypothetical protein LQ346_002271 [Caloplaca aetnensis]|nr:MAG: hypothetical protein LQ346_002271 [Caloplaca aetnensis]